MICSLKDFPVKGDGIQNDGAALQQAIDASVGQILHIPAGRYRVERTLLLPSHSHLVCDADAVLLDSGAREKHRGDFLISNADPVNGNEDITVEGGVWDGCFGEGANDKPKDLFAPDAWSGTLINFFNVRGLRLAHMKVQNTVVYHIRLGRIDGFSIEDILFTAERRAYNQDGLHFGGGCRNGLVRHIRAERGQTNDDLLALNADDSIDRLENRDHDRDVIENIEFIDIVAENCYTAVRLLSVGNPIRNLTFRNLVCGCRHYAINMDGARNARVPLVAKESDWPVGSGWIENIRFEHFRVWATESRPEMPLIGAETRCRNFRIEDFVRDRARDTSPEKLTLRAHNLCGAHIFRDGRETVLRDKSEVLEDSGDFTTFAMEQD